MRSGVIKGGYHRKLQIFNQLDKTFKNNASAFKSPVHLYQLNYFYNAYAPSFIHC